MSKTLLSNHTLRARLWGECGGTCPRCGKAMNPFEDFSIDHIIPVSLGGSDDPANLQVLCRRCNASKGGRNRIPRIRDVYPKEPATTWMPETIRSLRTRLGLTQAQLADRLGCSRQAVYLWEQGKRSPLKPYLMALDRLAQENDPPCSDVERM